MTAEAVQPASDGAECYRRSDGGGTTSILFPASHNNFTDA